MTLVEFFETIAMQNFSGIDTPTFVLVGTILMLLVLMPAARLLGFRSQPAESLAPQPASVAESSNQTILNLFSKGINRVKPTR
jgi:hypothetical protein